MEEIQKLKNKYNKHIENGRKIEAFTSMPEWQWYCETVINPTVNEYIDRIMRGAVESDKQEWILRGMIQGLRLVVESPANFKDLAEGAKQDAKRLNQSLKDES